MELLQAVVNALKLPDLRRKLLFTFGILIVYRLAAHVPMPGVDLAKLTEFFASNQLFGMLDLFSGGAMRNMSVASMGVYPYITASIIMQLLVPIVPSLEALAKEGEAGRNKINQYTHWLTVPLAMLQAYGQLALLRNQQVIGSFGLGGSDLLPTVAMVMAMTTGTMFAVWLGELITENGIGNGISIIIFGGIVASLPQVVGQSIFGSGNLIAMAAFAAIGLATVFFIVIFNEAKRQIPVQYAKRVRGNRVYGGGSTHVPLKVNSAGMIPLIFAISIMIFPGTVASYFTISENQFVADAARFVVRIFDTGSFLYWFLYFWLVVGFTFFYTMVIFQQQNLPENLQKYGGFIPGIRPGRPTAEFLSRVLTRITWAGAGFLGIVAVMPFLAQQFTSVQTLQLGSTSLLIVVGVVLDTMKQLEAQLLMRHYEGFIK